MIHELKTLPIYFNRVIEGRKLFEMRKDDRPFRVGDILALNEYIETNQTYTGRSCLVYVDFILRDTDYCKDGFVCMSIKPCLIKKVESPENFNRREPSYEVMLATDNDRVCLYEEL